MFFFGSRYARPGHAFSGRAIVFFFPPHRRRIFLSSCSFSMTLRRALFFFPCVFGAKRRIFLFPFLSPGQITRRSCFFSPKRALSLSPFPRLLYGFLLFLFSGRNRPACVPYTKPGLLFSWKGGFLVRQTRPGLASSSLWRVGPFLLFTYL